MWQACRRKSKPQGSSAPAASSCEAERSCATAGAPAGLAGDLLRLGCPAPSEENELWRLRETFGSSSTVSDALLLLALVGDVGTECWYLAPMRGLSSILRHDRKTANQVLALAERCATRLGEASLAVGVTLEDQLHVGRAFYSPVGAHTCVIGDGSNSQVVLERLLHHKVEAGCMLGLHIEGRVNNAGVGRFQLRHGVG